jgi:ferrochelatase
VEEGIARWPEADRPRVHIVFSAHSLPERVLASGDPYGEQCLETARLVAARAASADDRWSWAYQSAAARRAMGRPRPRRALEELAGEGVRDVVSVPVGFVSDHVEILFDIDHKAAAVAAGLGCGSSDPLR